MKNIAARIHMKQTSKSQKYFFNAVLLSAVTVGLRAISVSFNAFVAKKIGSQALGLFTLVTSVYSLAITLAVSGVNLAAVRMTSERLARCEQSGVTGKALRRALREELAGCIGYSLFFGLFAGILLFTLSGILGTYVLGDIRTIPSLRLLSIGLVPISLSSALAGYFTGLRKVYKNAAISICEQFIQIALVSAGLVIIAPKGIEYACLALVGGAAISEIASLILAIILYITDRGVKIPSKTTAQPLYHRQKSGALSRAASIAFPVAAGSYMRQGLLCAEHLAIPAGLRKSGTDPETSLASYGVLHGMAFPLIFFPSSVISAFASLLVPELSECLATDNKIRAREIGIKVIRVSLWFSMGVAGIFLAFSHALGTGVYDSAEAGRYIAAFAPLVPLMYLDTSVDSILKGLGQQVYCMKVNILDAGLSLILVLTLVPHFGIWGYVACVYITETVNAALSISRMLAVTKIRFRLRWVAVPALSVLAACTGVRLLTSFMHLVPPMPVQIAAAAVMYIILLLAFRSISRSDIQYAKKMLLHT